MRQRPVDNKNSMTSCHKGGIKIRDTGNNAAADPFAGVNPFNIMPEQKAETITHDKNSYESLDLNIENYNVFIERDLLKELFVINSYFANKIIEDLLYSRDERFLIILNYLVNFKIIN